MARHLLDVLAELHALDVDAIGLGELGRREGLRRAPAWRAGRSSGTHRRPARSTASTTSSPNWRGARVPPQQCVAVVHGDYRFGNAVTDPATGAVAPCSTGSVHAR